MQDSQEHQAVSRKGEISRGAIITSATKLIVEHGFSTVTIQDVLDHAKVTKGKFFHYFSSKDELFRTILLEAMDSRRIFDFEEVVSELPVKSSFQKLLLLFDKIIDWHRQGLPAEMRLCVMATSFFPPNGAEMKWVKKLLGKNMAVITDLLERSKQEGDLPPFIRAEGLALLMPSATIGGNVIEFLSAGERLPAKNLATLRQLLECAHRAMGSKV
jgi:AcrR family transcriptional regulator